MVSMLEFGGAKMPLERNSRIHFNMGLGGVGMQLLDIDLDLDEKSNREAIHSGHFMVSEIDDSKVQEEEEEGSLLAGNEDDGDQVVLSPKQEDINLGMKVPDVTVGATSRKESMELETFNPRTSQSISIDASLTKLLECMSLVYSGKLTSPRWKTFKGVKMRLKEKIRLNNIIWRAWHLQFVAKRKPFVCQFASPLEGETRNKPEAVVLEGKYLKRGMKTVIAEYKKCRMFYRDRMRCLKYMENNSAAMDLDFRFPSWSNSSLASGLDDDITIMDFSDTLFGSLIPSEPFDFPNPREIARAGIADLIQPGLVQLQPALDDFMDTFEPLHGKWLWPDIFQSRPLPTLPEEGPISDSGTLNKQIPSASIDNSNFVSNMNFSSIINAQMSYLSANASQTRNNAQSSSLQHSLSKTNDGLLKSTTLQQNTAVFSNDNFNSSSTANIACISPLMASMETPSSFTPETVLQSPTNSGAASPILSHPVVEAGTSNIKILPRSQSPGPQTATASVFFPKHGKGKAGLPGSPVRRSTVTTPPNMRSLIQPKLNKNQQCSNASSILKPPKALNDALKSRVGASMSNFSTSYGTESSLVKNTNLQSTLMNVNRQSKVQSPVHAPLLGRNQISIAPATTPGNLTTPQSFQVLALQSTEEPFKFNAPPHMLSKTKRNTIRMDTPGYRRHSYTGHLTPGFSQDNLQMKSPSVSNQNVNQKEVQFAIPKGQVVKQRARSRSVSSPQHSSGALKAISAKPPQAISLTNINLNHQTVQPILPASPQNIHPMPTSQISQLLPMRMGMSPITTTTNNNRIRTNTVLAQLLSTAYSSPDGTTSSSSSNTKSTVTIIGTVPPVSSGPQTLVLSPVTLTTMPGVNDIQNTLLVGSSGSVFSNTLGSQKISLPVTTSTGVTLGGISTQSAQKPGSDTNSQAGSHTPKIFRPKSSEEKIQYKEHKRVCHINAEQKRRCNIKHGFEALHQLVPSLCHNPSSKVSKAAMLQKAVDYIRTLKAERTQQMEEAENLKKEIDQLNQTINTYQNQLPASGAPVPFQRTNHMRERFEEYVKACTLQNWKFWIFSLLMEPLLESYSNTVSTASIDDLCKTTITWLDQHCSLALLRPMVLNSLTHLCTTTNILTDPSRLPEEASRAIAKKEKKNASK